MHRSGRKHGNADTLSRMPCQQCGRATHEDMPEPTLGIAPVTSAIGGVLREKSPSELRLLQLQDPTLGPVLRAVEEGIKPDPDTVKGKSPDLRRLIQMWDQLQLYDGILWRLYEEESGTTRKHQLKRVVRRNKYIASQFQCLSIDATILLCWCPWLLWSPTQNTR